MSLVHASFDAFDSANWATWHHHTARVVKTDKGFILTQREDVLEALRNGDLYGPRRIWLGGLERPPLTLEGDEHIRWRRLLAPFFSPQAAAAMEPDLRELARQQIALRGPSHTRATAPSTGYVSGSLALYVGLPRPPEGYGHAADMANSALFDAQVQHAFIAYIRNWVRDALPDSMINRLRAELTEDEIVAFVGLLLTAADETSVEVIRNAETVLADDPALRRRLHNHPTEIPVFVEEVIRLWPPVQRLVRILKRDTNIDGVTIPAGSRIIAFTGNVNREPGDDIEPKVQRHYGYGAGPHRCVGIHLARKSISVLIEEWLTTLEDNQ
jgi:cytochrome P450